MTRRHWYSTPLTAATFSTPFRGESSPAIHRLKTHPPYFQHIVDRKKAFEVRWNDREFKVGDKLVLEEFDPKARDGEGDYHSGAVGLGHIPWRACRGTGKRGGPSA